MRVLLVIAVGAMGSAGCGGTPSCEDAIHKASTHIPQLASPNEASQVVARCIKDQWPAELRICVARAKDQPEVKACMTRPAASDQQVMGASKAELAKRKAKRYAAEAYPQWLAAHPGKACPDKLEDLNEYMTDNDTLDPWGRPYRMMCGPTMAGAKGLAVISAGEDGKPGTADDIKSWE